jgi:hypothetical protein
LLIVKVFKVVNTSDYIAHLLAARVI